MNKKTLYQKGKKGEIREWSIWSSGDTVYTEYGNQGGKMQIASFVCTPKNVGRSNETSGEEQADLEAKALYKKKLDKKYFESVDEAENTELLLPMLANTWKFDPKYNGDWFIQRKYNGIRCLAYWEDGKVVLRSRENKDFNVPHIAKELENIMPEEWILDGELYVHGEMLQDIVSLVKKEKEGSQMLTYVVYDAPKVDGSSYLFNRRLECYEELFDEIKSDIVIPCETELIANNEELIREMEQEYVKEGYEGAILRSPDGEYCFGHRSSDLLKVKSFVDSEFEVIGFRDGIGKCVGQIIFECKNDLSDATFEVTPKCSADRRKEMYLNGQSYIGRMYTVKYFGRTKDNIPFLPVGLAFQLDR